MLEIYTFCGTSHPAELGAKSLFCHSSPLFITRYRFSLLTIMFWKQRITTTWFCKFNAKVTHFNLAETVTSGNVVISVTQCLR